MNPTAEVIHRTDWTYSEKEQQ